MATSDFSFLHNVATSLSTQAFSFLHPKISTHLHECPTTISWFTSVPISQHSILHAKSISHFLPAFHSSSKSIGGFLLAFHSSSKKHWWVAPGIPFFKHFPQTDFPFFLFNDVNMACWFFTKSVVHVKMACWFFIKSIVHAGSCHPHTHTHCNSLCNCSRQLCSLQRCSSTNEWHYCLSVCLSVSAGGRKKFEIE